MTWQRLRGNQPSAEGKNLGTIVEVPGFQIGVSVIAVALAALMGVLFYFGDVNTRETLDFIVVAGALSGGAITAHHVWLGLKTSIEQRMQALEEQKVTLSLSFCTRWNDPNMATLRRDWRHIRPRIDASANPVNFITSSDIEVRTVVADVLNFFEEMGYAARSGAADLETLERVFRGVVLNYFNTTQAWIHLRRKESKESAQAWSEFEWLRDQWKNH